MQYLQGQRLLILGLGISGLSMARWCVRCGAVVRVADTRSNPSGLHELQKLVPELDFVAGKFNAEHLLKSDDSLPLTRVLRSPGLSPQDAAVNSVLAIAQDMGVLVQGELDLFTEALKHLNEKKIQEEEALLVQTLKERAGENLTENSGNAEDLNEGSVVMQLPEDVPTSPETNVTNHNTNDTEFDIDVDLEGLFDEVEEPIIGEVIEPLPLVVGYKPQVIAITGTNGKTTVTSLTTQLIERAGKTVVAAGNIGTAMMDALSQKIDAHALPEVWVLELSSFQLDGAVAFDPTVATILNLTQDHLDWHGTMHNYAAAKGHVFGEHTTRVLNRDDEQVMAFKLAEVVEEKPLPKRRKGPVKVAAPKMITFGADEPQNAGDFGIANDGGMPWLAQAVAAHETALDEHSLTMKLLMPVDALRIRGRHNATNALAALALACHAGCDMAPMLFGLREYGGEPHRVEAIAMVDGVEYIDDSKGTNVGATAAALAGLGVDHRIVLILGGQGKGQDFSPLTSLIQQYVRAVVLIGQDALLIEAALQETGVPMLHAQSMQQAVTLCAQQAGLGDVVLLSPACASLDMFSNYMERAQVFARAVQELAESQGQITEVTGWAL